MQTPNQQFTKTRILMTGGTGLIGTHLVGQYPNACFTILSRTSREKSLNTNFIKSFDELPSTVGIDLVINLAGEPIDTRWTKAKKQKIWDSRVLVTQALASFISRLRVKPSVMISASAVGFYGAINTTPILEDTTPGAGFSHDLCKAWEGATLSIANNGVRVCLLRLAPVLSRKGGVIRKSELPFKTGLGARLGSGRQIFPWVHIDDVIHIIRFLVEKDACKGPFNVTAPHLCSNDQWSQAFASVFAKKVRISIPKSVIRVAFGQMGKELLLTSCPSSPARLLELGFQFTYPKIEEALKNLYTKEL